MDNFLKFQNFIEGRKEKQLMDIKDGLAGEDNDGPLATHPPKEAFAKAKPLPYKNVSDDDKKNVVWQAKDNGEKKKPLADEATPGLTTKTSIPDGKDPESKVENPKHVKMTSEEFIDKTKNMSDAEFAKYMLEHHPDMQLTTISDLYGNEFTPDPMQTIQYLSGLMLGNERMMERFIREMKRRDGLDSLIKELMAHPECYDTIVKMLEESDCGEDRAHELARSMNDHYVSIMDNIDFGESVNEVIDAPPAKRFGLDQKTKPMAQKLPGGQFGGGSGPDMTPDSEYQGNNYQKQGGSFGGGGIGTQQQQPQFADQQPLQAPGMKAKGMMRYMGESASDNLIKAMSGYDHMKDRMIHHCTGPHCK